MKTRFNPVIAIAQDAKRRARALSYLRAGLFKT